MYCDLPQLEKEYLTELFHFQTMEFMITITNTWKGIQRSTLNTSNKAAWLLTSDDCSMLYCDECRY